MKLEQDDYCNLRKCPLEVVVNTGEKQLAWGPSTASVRSTNVPIGGADKHRGGTAWCPITSTACVQI